MHITVQFLALAVKFRQADPSSFIVPATMAVRKEEKRPRRVHRRRRRCRIIVATISGRSVRRAGGLARARKILSAKFNLRSRL